MTTVTDEKSTPGQVLEERGPWPFVTRRVHRHPDGTVRVWSSRHHRKGLLLPEAAEALELTERLLRCLWMPGYLNWWIGVVFAIGASLFALASVFILAPVRCCLMISE